MPISPAGNSEIFPVLISISTTLCTTMSLQGGNPPSTFALPSVGGINLHRGNFPLMRVVQIQSKSANCSAFCHSFARRFCCKTHYSAIFRRYHSHFSLIFSLFALTVFENPGDVHLDVLCRQWAGDEALGIKHLLRHSK